MPSHVRLTLGGRVVGAQRWSIGHTVVLGSANPLNSQLNALAEGCFAQFKTSVWNGTGTGKLQGANVAQTTLDNARAYFYEGDSTKASRIGVSSGAAVTGGGSSTGTVPQAALVATLEDGLAGRNHKGRMYLPLNAFPVAAATLQLAQSDAAAFAASVAAYFTALINTSPVPGLTITPVVSSLTIGSPLSAVSVDTVVDTQRRRRDKIVGTRSRSTIVVG